MAMVFQSYALYPHLTVAKNIEFPLRQRGVDKAERALKVKRAAETLGLATLLDRKPGQLSGGQRQRVALARAIVREPLVFLMDEPLSNLDAALRAQTRADIVELQARLATTTLYVTHDQVEAMTMGDRIAVMSEGKLQQVATPEALYAQPGQHVRGPFPRQPRHEPHGGDARRERGVRCRRGGGRARRAERGLRRGIGAAAPCGGRCRPRRGARGRPRPAARGAAPERGRGHRRHRGHRGAARRRDACHLPHRDGRDGHCAPERRRRPSRRSARPCASPWTPTPPRTTSSTPPTGPGWGRPRDGGHRVAPGPAPSAGRRRACVPGGASRPCWPTC